MTSASGRRRPVLLVGNDSDVDRLRVSRSFRDPRLPIAGRRETPVHLPGGRRSRGRSPEGGRPLMVVRYPALRTGRVSLDGDGGAGALESSLGLLGGVLGDLLQDGLRRVVHQVLGLLE